MSAARKEGSGRGRRKRSARQPRRSVEEAAGEGAATVVVDRREGDHLVVIDDAGRSADVPIARIPRIARREGAILRVPLGTNGDRLWEKAVRDRVEEGRRRALLEGQVKRLKRTDPGGDIVL